MGTVSLQDNAVTAVKIATNAVTEGKITDGSVTANKLANNVVTTAKIADANITAAKFHGDLTGSEDEAEAGTATNLRLWSALRLRQAFLEAADDILGVVSGTTDNVKTFNNTSPHTVHQMTQAQYTALSSKDSRTLYVIVG